MLDKMFVVVVEEKWTGCDGGEEKRVGDHFQWIRYLGHLLLVLLRFIEFVLLSADAIVDGEGKHDHPLS